MTQACQPVAAAPPLWRQELAEAISDLHGLCAAVQLDAAQLGYSEAAAKSFAMRVPRGFAARIEAGNAADPLLRQILPHRDELAVWPGYSQDPVGDMQALAVPGVLHKYHGRALLIATGACAVHCRYCFRRNLPYAELRLGKSQRAQALAYLEQHPDIEEVILSGGDPLLLDDATLHELLQALAAIPHVRRIRIHSRIPVVLPSRITATLVGTLRALPQAVVFVAHCNHAREIDNSVRAALAQLRDAGCTLLNQAVLLRGVNDDGDSLCQLSETLFAAGVLPYYLHLLDKAHGTAHFDVPEETAKQLIENLRQRLPGYLVPKLVREQAGQASKLAIA